MVQIIQVYSKRDGCINEEGFDRVALGEQLPDPNIGKRMFTLSGVAGNDAQGFERGGLGLNQLPDGKSRSVIGVDNEKGEAVTLLRWKMAPMH